MDKEKIIELAKKGEKITDSRNSEGCWACRNCDESSCNLLALFVKIRQEAETDRDQIVHAINSHEKKCEWSQCESAEEVYSTDCGRMFEFTHDGPKENHFTHCPYCGGILVNLVEQVLEESEKEQ